MKTESEGWIMTHTGKHFYPMIARLQDIDILDIAQALSNICRFTGHCSEFFSVAQHSVNVSHKVPKRLALHGLLHDAAEAYLCDVSRPVKYLPGMAAYRQAETVLSIKILKRFGLDPRLGRDQIKRVDRRMVLTEGRDLGMRPETWGFRQRPYAEKIQPLTPEFAKMAFLGRYLELVGLGVSYRVARQ